MKILLLLAGLLLPAVAFAAQAPDTPVVTGPNFQQVPVGSALVTIPNVGQMQLGAALGGACGVGGSCTVSGGTFTDGTINNMAIGGVTPAAGTFTALGATGNVTAGASTQDQIVLMPQASGTDAEIAAQGAGATIGLLLQTKNGGVVHTGAQGILRGGYLSASGASYVWSSNNAGEGHSALYSAAGFSGTASTGTAAWNYIAINTDTVAASTAAGGLASGFAIAHNFGGAAMTGGRVGMSEVLSLTATSGNASGASYVGGSWLVQASANDNGVSGTPHSALFGINPQVILNSGATFWAGLDGAEFDIGAKSGSSVSSEYGVAIVKIAGDVAVPTGETAGITINNQYAQGSGAGWNYGIIIGKTGGRFPLPTTGTMIYGEDNGGTFTVTNGIDWSLGAFSGNSWNDGHFILSGAGEFIGSKITDPNTAPGAGKVKLTMEAGTNAGSCKIVARAGTSATPVTVIDNVGSGC